MSPILVTLVTLLKSLLRTPVTLLLLSTTGYGTAAELGSVSCGLIFQKEAAGCVEAIAPQVQVTSGDVSVIYQGDVILGRLAMGADYLNPAAAVELYVGGTAPSAF